MRTQLTLNEVANHVAGTRPQGKTLDEDEDHISEFVVWAMSRPHLSGTHAVSETMDRLLEDGHDPETPVAAIYHASWPDEDVIEGTIATIGEKLEDAGYRASALVVIGDAVDGDDYERSFLYGDWARGSDADSQDADD